VWAVTLLPSFLPVLSVDATFAWADRYSELIPLAVTLAFLVAASRVPAARERTFWLLLAGMVVTMLVNKALYVLVPVSEWEAAIDVSHDAMYLVSYFLVALALERRPDRNPAKRHSAALRHVETSGLLVFLFGLLGYFIVIPLFKECIYYTMAGKSQITMTK